MLLSTDRIEKVVGDAAITLFGVPRAHDDAPVRAVNAALEIDRLVESLCPLGGQSGI